MRKNILIGGIVATVFMLVVVGEYQRETWREVYSCEYPSAPWIAVSCYKIPVPLPGEGEGIKRWVLIPPDTFDAFAQAERRLTELRKAGGNYEDNFICEFGWSGFLGCTLEYGEVSPISIGEPI